MVGKSIRLESDLLGNLEVEADALFGIQTWRAVCNFPATTNSRAIGDYPQLVAGLLAIKQAAALANQRAGLLLPDKSRAICDAASQLCGRISREIFPVHSLHGGGGTSANMNVNEVVANLGEELLGGKRGEYVLLHPNDHVNLNQSTNDVYPTACHIAVILQWESLYQSLVDLLHAIQDTACNLKGVDRIARTCLQEAVIVSFADLFGGYVDFISRSIYSISGCVEALYSINLGGTIVGRKKDVPPAYLHEIIPTLCEVLNEKRYVTAKNLFDAAQNPDDMIRVSSSLNILGRGLIKICKDLRLMASGPESGFVELHLPPVQPGSSIMPGKINPVIPEFVIQLCFQVAGCHAACQMALDHGELDLNIWESTIVFNILDSMSHLQEAVTSLRQNCIQGLKCASQKSRNLSELLIPQLTDLASKYGYSRVNELCKQADGNTDLLKQLIMSLRCSASDGNGNFRS